MISHHPQVEHYYKVADILLAMEAQLRYLELWELEDPNEEQL